MRRRDDLLTRLESAAPAWAAHIRARVDRHGTATVPNDIPAAWRRRQFEDALRRREAASLSDIMLTLEQRREALADATTELVVRKAWQAQALRTSLEQRQALVGFADAKKRLGRGTGKRAAAFARTARECMIKARSAVPVWIMPTVKAAETFDPRSTRFDVVIVDEASQSDVTGLIALYLGKQVIVVGDDEQVSPSAVGEKAPAAQHLIDAFLTDIPNAQLYDGKQSLYDIAKASFGGTICLLEHFRCVPDIIRFSNELCYEGRMKPLREPQPNNPVPAVVAHRVTSSGTIGKINHDEARTVTALVAAVIDQPEYIDKSIGIISLVGNEQACLIEELLRGILAPTEIQARRLLCGGATHFQGDERDIMFLSVVDAGKGASLQLRRDRAFRQRLNVAASRARDQMWVVHSLDPSELKNGDLRRALLTHAMNPSAPENEGAEPTREVSPFEAEILQRLTAAGFRVQTHRRVGAYRAGIVVTGERGRRLVVECEGDRLYRAEELAHDAERQTVLERLGWKFAHIRAGNFYRSPEEAMRSIFQRLQTLGIPPLPTEPEARRSDIADELLSRIGARAAEILASL
jgi:very-short-patch-repair endonuclease